MTAAQPLAPTAYAPRRTQIRLWIPLTLILLLIVAPLALILFPLVALACLIMWINPVALYWHVGAVLASVSGTDVHVDTPDTLIRIRIF